MRVAILAPVIMARDAIGADIQEMARNLRECGCEVRLFSDARSQAFEEVAPYTTLASWLQGPDDVLIYHHSIGWAPAEALLGNLRCRRIVRYHNITPPEFFYGISRDYVRMCAAGRAEVMRLAAHPELEWMSDSSYNEDELFSFGVPKERSCVVAPFHRMDHLLGIEADHSLLADLDEQGAKLLMVGRIAPNKGYLALIDAFACYVGNYDPHAELLIVGKQDPLLVKYRMLMHERIAHYGLGTQVCVYENVTDRGLKACYERADAMLYLSEHEGFGVPLVEAMVMSLPIVGRAIAATPYTVGDAGMLWDGADPRAYAASLARLRSDPRLRQQLVDAGHARYEQMFARDVLAGRFRQAMGVAVAAP